MKFFLYIRYEKKYIIIYENLCKNFEFKLDYVRLDDSFICYNFINFEIDENI